MKTSNIIRISPKNQFRFIPVFLAVMILATAPFAISGCDKGKDHAEHNEPEGYYTCPMHPQVISHEPGTCPICGMTLVFQEHEESGMSPGMSNETEETGNKEDHSQHENHNSAFRFRVAQNVLVNSNLLTVGVEKKHFVRKSDYSAHIDFNEDPDRLVVISTKYDGWVEKLYVSKEGQVIRKGDVLLGVYSPQILAAKEEYLTTFSSLKQLYESQGKPLDELRQDPTLKASRQKLRYLDVSENQINEMETSGEATRLTYYHSPIGGVVVKKDVLQGVYIKPGQEVFRIANLDTLWAFIHIFEKDLPLIEKGNRVTLRTTAYPDQEITGRIDLIYPFLEKTSKDIKVRIVIPNHQGHIKPGMFATVVIETHLPGETLVLPESAIIYSGERNYVFISLGNGNFELHPIEVRIASGGEAAVSGGLKEGDQVVVNGQYLLDSEASLKEAVSKRNLAGQQGGGHVH